MRISSVLAFAVFALGVAAQGQKGETSVPDADGNAISKTTTSAISEPTSESTLTTEEKNVVGADPMNQGNAKHDATDHKGSEANIGAIVGGVVGGLFGVGLVGLLLWFGARRRKKQHNIQQRSRALINLDKAQPGTPSPTPGITDAPLPAVPTDRNSIGGGGAPMKHEVQQGPVELQSREVDPDGVSVRSFDLEGGRQGRNQGEVPRLPIYGGGNAAL